MSKVTTIVLVILALVVFSGAALAKEYTGEIIGPIQYASDYSKLHSTLHKATEKDTVVITVNSPGGKVSIMNTIIKSIKNSKAHVKIVVENSAMSAAAMIATSGDELEVKPRSQIMFHLGSISVSGANVVILKTFLEAHIDRLYTQINSCCSIEEGRYPLLTEKDMNSILAGGDLYLFYESTVKRLGSNIAEPRK